MGSECVSTYSGGLALARYLYKVAVELGKAAQLCVFILGYLYLGVLKCVFRIWYAVSVLVTRAPSGCAAMGFSGRNTAISRADPQDLFKIMQFSGKFKGKPILSKLWA